MSAREGQEHAEANPVGEEFGRSVAEESADIGAAVGLSRKTKGNRHRHRPLHVLLFGIVVAGPCGGIALATENIGACEHERAFVGVYIEEAVACAFHHEAAICVVVEQVRTCGKTATATVYIVVGHRAYAVEHGRFVNIVPHAVDTCGEEIFIEPCPPGAHFGHGEVGECSHAGPYFSLIFASVGAANPHIVLGSRFVHEVFGIGFRRGVDHIHSLEIGFVQIVVKCLGIGEFHRVEREYAEAVHIVDVHPYHVAWYVTAAEVCGDVAYFGLGVVGESALVIAERP